MERLRHGELELTGVNGGEDREWVSTRDSATVVLFIGVLGFVSKQGTLGEGRFGRGRADETPAGVKRRPRRHCRLGRASWRADKWSRMCVPRPRG